MKLFEVEWTKKLPTENEDDLKTEPCSSYVRTRAEAMRLVKEIESGDEKPEAGPTVYECEMETTGAKATVFALLNREITPKRQVMVWGRVAV